MRQTRQFSLSTSRMQDGYVYSYDTATELFCGIVVNQRLTLDGTSQLLSAIKPTLSEFLSWAGTIKNVEVVELRNDITFTMFGEKYNDKSRSSKKRSEKLWDKLNKENQVKAFYHIDNYMRHKGNAEKKYCETYLQAELWNN